MTKTNLDYKICGVRGGNPQYKANVGYVTTFVDNMVITADAFEGYGRDYKQRKENLITISYNNGKPLFNGTVDELIAKLS
jgi:hypothetical protein